MPRVPRETLAYITPDGDLVPGTSPGTTRVWPFTQNRRLLWRATHASRLDPVNIAVLHAVPDTVLDALRGQGWSRPGDGATHRTWVNGTFRSMVDHIALGERSERVHARVFAVGDLTVIAAHHEVANARGKHIVTSWDQARDVTLDALERAGYRRIAPSAVVTAPNLRGVRGDGRVWRLIPPDRV